jgi:hypothetical protein
VSILATSIHFRFRAYTDVDMSLKQQETNKAARGRGLIPNNGRSLRHHFQTSSKTHPVYKLAGIGGILHGIKLLEP